MRYQVLASDYDGTLARDGQVDSPTIATLEKFRATGRRLVLVTGRVLPELIVIFPRIDLFEWVVAENGALLYHPASRQMRALADPPPEKFIQALRQRGVTPLAVGNIIVATLETQGKTVLQTIHDCGLEMQVIFNKGSVMVLPTGINKATGLTVALMEMGLSARNAVGVGDAENDHALLRLCDYSAAVANALPALKEMADFVASADHGAGVCELIDRIIACDLPDAEDRLPLPHLSTGAN